MPYMPTLGWFGGVNVGIYGIHGVYGYGSPISRVWAMISWLDLPNRAPQSWKRAERAVFHPSVLAVPEGCKTYMSTTMTYLLGDLG